MDKQALKQELILRALAQKDLYTFLKLKWQRYNNARLMEGWHINYICKILEHTLPSACALGMQSQGGGKGSLLDANDRADNANSPKSAQKNHSLITRLMLNMPPSYGKTEIIARTFIAWALGTDRKRKFFYISYSDDLCRKIANQVRDLLKSKLWSDVFGCPPQFLQDNAQEFVLREGGGLFVTTLKSALTGFHADQILIDDPIKVSEMSSKAARNLVNQNFKESVLSRLQNNQSNITILMQRLSTDDLCGFLTNEREFDKNIINQWQQISLKAIEKEDKTYSIGDFSYFRKKGEALFSARHTESELEHLRLQMGNDEFSSQYLQEPLISSGGYFDEQYFSFVWGHEIGAHNDYIFVDNAMSLKASADNRAIVVVAVEHYKQSTRYIVQDCLFGIWSEEESIRQILSLKAQYKKAKTYIESDGGGIVLHRLLLSELARFNQKAKENAKELLEDNIFCYTASRKVAKVDKIKAMRPFYNSGFLLFNHNARGLEQLKKELFSFNPDKPFRKDDCIDALSSCLIHPDVRAPALQECTPSLPRHKTHALRRTWRI